MNGIRVSESQTGQGVFATRRFRANESIGHVTGQRIEDPKYGSDYCIDLDGQLSLEPAAPFRFLNHSCEPNCALVVYEAQDFADPQDAVDAPEVWVEAISDIQPGQQLTIDYAWPAESAVPCRCGSPNCRGWIVAPEQVEEFPSAASSRRTMKSD